MNNRCHFSEDRVYRYTLAHIWHKRDPVLAVIGLNPSTADENTLDPTLTRIKDFTNRWGYGGFVMLNLFAARATQPRVMKRMKDPVGPENDKWIRKAVQKADAVWVCWGNHGDFMNRDREVLRMLAAMRITPAAVKVTQLGQPMHPLYVPKDTRAFPYVRRG